MTKKGKGQRVSTRINWKIVRRMWMTVKMRACKWETYVNLVLVD